MNGGFFCLQLIQALLVLLVFRPLHVCLRHKFLLKRVEVACKGKLEIFYLTVNGYPSVSRSFEGVDGHVIVVDLSAVGVKDLSDALEPGFESRSGWRDGRRGHAAKGRG